MCVASVLRSSTNKSHTKLNLLQAYRDDRLSAPNPGPVSSTYIDAIVDRLAGSRMGARESKEALRTIIQKLAKYNEIFERFLEYAEDSAKRKFSVGFQSYV